MPVFNDFLTYSNSVDGGPSTVDRNTVNLARFFAYIKVSSNQFAMTIQQFNSLTETEKIVAIMEDGRLFAQSLEEKCRIFLYSLGSFYVTASYRTENDDLEEISSFKRVDESTSCRRIIVKIHPAARAEKY